MSENDEAIADQARRSGRRRIAIFSSLFLTWQLFYFLVAPDRGDSLRNVDIVRSIGLLAWSLALLLLFARGGAIIRPTRLADFLDDERALAIRAASYRAGFWTMIVICYVGYAAAMFGGVRAIDLAHICLSAGILAVLFNQLYRDRD